MVLIIALNLIQNLFLLASIFILFDISEMAARKMRRRWEKTSTKKFTSHLKLCLERLRKMDLRKNDLIFEFLLHWRKHNHIFTNYESSSVISIKIPYTKKLFRFDCKSPFVEEQKWFRNIGSLLWQFRKWNKWIDFSRSREPYQLWYETTYWPDEPESI